MKIVKSWRRDERAVVILEGNAERKNEIMRKSGGAAGGGGVKSSGA